MVVVHAIHPSRSVSAFRGNLGYWVSAFGGSLGYTEKVCLEKQIQDLLSTLRAWGSRVRVEGGRKEGERRKMCSSIKTKHTQQKNKQTKTVKVRTCVRTGL